MGIIRILVFVTLVRAFIVIDGEKVWPYAAGYAAFSAIPAILLAGVAMGLAAGGIIFGVTYIYFLLLRKLDGTTAWWFVLIPGGFIVLAFV